MTDQERADLARKYLDLAHRAEAARDACVYGSREYDRHYDLALMWHGLADALTPKEQRTTEDSTGRKVLTRICAWCQTHQGGPRPALRHPQSHGICPHCSDKMLEGVA